MKTYSNKELALKFKSNNEINNFVHKNYSSNKNNIEKLLYLKTQIVDSILIEAWKKNKCAHYSISHRQSYSVKEVANMFRSKIIFLEKRAGERYASALTRISLNNKVFRRFGKINLKDYISSFIKG